MTERKVWIRIMGGNTEEVTEDTQAFILGMTPAEELLGDITVVLYFEELKSKKVLSHIYEVSETALPVLKEKFGDANVMMTESHLNNCAKSPLPNPNPDPLERIADALEAIGSTLDSIDQSLDLLSDVVADARVKNRYGSSISVCGTIQQL